MTETDIKGNTSLLMAAWSGHVEMVRWLLTHGRCLCMFYWTVYVCAVYVCVCVFAVCDVCGYRGLLIPRF